MEINEKKKLLSDLIKDQTKGKITEEQINQIIERINLEEGQIPTVNTTNNPHEFENNSRREKDVFEHSWAGSTSNIRETEVLIGDYEPGIDDIYEYNENGDTRNSEETHEMSDFSINQMQVALTKKEYSDHYNGTHIDEYDETIEIYLPEEKEYSEKDTSFKKMVINERKKQLSNEIKEKVGNKLTEEQINQIVEKFNLEKGIIPIVNITNNPHEFENNSRREKDVFEHSWAGSTSNIKETEVLIGDYEPGIDDRYQYSENGDKKIPEETHEMSDFSINQMQVALTKKEYLDYYNGAHIDEYDETIEIYLPEENKYSENLRFKDIIKTDLERKEEELTNLKAEARTIAEAEALIEKQTEKKGKDIGEN